MKVSLVPLKTLWQRMTSIWDRLVRPHPAIRDRETQQQARVLAVLSLTLLVMYFIPELFRLTHSALPLLSKAYIFITVLCLAVAYLASRTPQPGLGAWVMLIPFMLGPIVGLLAAAQQQQLNHLTIHQNISWGVVALLIGALLLPPWHFALLYLFGLAALLGVAHHLAIPAEWLIHPITIFTIVSLILLSIVGTRKRFFQALSASEQRFRNLFAAAPDALVIHDGRRILEINPAFEKMFGFSREEAFTKGIRDLVAPRDAERVAQAIWRHLQTPTSAETLVMGLAQRADGTTFPAEIKLGTITVEGQRLYAVSIRDISRRVEAEAQAHLLLQAAEQSANAIVITDRQGRIEYVNPAFTQITGYAKDEVLGQNPRILKSGHHPPEFYASMWQILLQGQIWQGEIVNRRKDGSLYWERETITPIVDERGEITRFIAIKEDITAQKAAEEQIRKLQEAVEQSANAIVITDRQGRIEYVNPAFTRLTGYTREEALGQSPKVLKSGKHSKAFYAQLWETILQGEIWQGEILNRRKDGTLYWEQMTITPVVNAHGEITHFVAIKEDITQRKEAEEQIRLLKEAVEQSGTAIFIVQPQGTVEYANPAAERLTGYRREEMVGHPISIISPLQSEAPQFTEMLAHIQRYEPWRGTMQLRRKKGAPRWVYLSLAPILDAEGQPLHFVVVMEDITHQKELEEALRQARDEALEANRMKTSLLAHVSHDMRTPLGGILGFAEMMLAEALGPLTERQREALQRILDSTRTLVDFTNDLIHQAELESGRLRLKPQPFAPAELLKVLPSYVGLAEAKGLKVHTYVDPDLPEQVIGDLYWLRRILANLLSNAAKFTDQGEIWIRLLRQEGDRWALQVQDTGIGIPPDMQSKIFEPFRQGDDSPTRRHGGSGLGLSIVKQLVELMQGEILLESTPGKGSTFTILLPCGSHLLSQEATP